MNRHWLSLFIILFFNQAGFAGTPFMSEALNSWVGYSINNLIDSWGYPSTERTIAGRQLYIWENVRNVYVPRSTTGQISSYGYNQASINTYTTGGYSVEYYCTRTMEVDSNNIVRSWEWKGNNCPITYFTGKIMVNPENDKWQRQMIEKQRAKEAKKQMKRAASSKENTIRYDFSKVLENKN